MPTHQANAVINEETGASLEYRHLINDASTFPIWNKAAANEVGSLAQGVGDRVTGSDKIFFIPRQAVPKGKIITYGLRDVVCVIFSCLCYPNMRGI
jgi:hypothetical protein